MSIAAVSPSQLRHVAVVGSGISGLGAAWALSKAGHQVTLLESGPYFGGHTNTVDVEIEGQRFGVDTGFLVFNPNTYPNLLGLFDELGVRWTETDMSFAVSLDEARLEWAGTNLNTVFGQRANVLRPRFWQMVREILRFNARAKEHLQQSLSRSWTLGELLRQEGYGEALRDDYLLPMAAAIWSSSPQDILQFPAATFLRFCLNHSLLQVEGRPKWRTVTGGARHYVQAILPTLHQARLATPVRQIRRDAQGVSLQLDDGELRADAVVLATHAPTSLSLLADASPLEREVLGAFRTSLNRAYLHTDEAWMPRRRRVWSAWNYLGRSAAQDAARPVCVSYWLNALQPLPVRQPLFVTLNPWQAPREDRTLQVMDYQHPVMDPPAIAAQQRLHEIQGRQRTWFAGAWQGYGFHEDGLKSGLRVAADFQALPAWAQL